MKKLVRLITLVVFLSLVAGGCNKLDWNNWGGGNNGKNYIVQKFSISSPYFEGSFPFFFQKTIDTRDKSIKELEAYFYTYAGHVFHARMSVEAKGKMMYLVNEDSPYDTTITAYLNQKGRVVKAITIAPLIGIPPTVTTEFTYLGDRLDSIIYSDSYMGFSQRFGMKCSYDQYGNITGMVNRSSTPAWGIFYKYDYTKKANHQFYADDMLADFDNVICIFHYLDMFPELNPVNLRTFFGDGNEGNPYVYHDISNHVIDPSGNLVGYDYVLNKSEEVSHAIINWVSIK